MENFVFNIFQSNAYKQSKRVIFYGKSFLVKVLKFLGYFIFPITLIIWLFIFISGLFFAHYFETISFLPGLKLITGLFAAIGGISLWIFWFIQDRLVGAKPSLTINEAKNFEQQGQMFNLAEALDAGAAQMMANTYSLSVKDGQNLIDPAFLFLSLANSEIGGYLFVRMGLNPKDIIELKIKPYLSNLPKNNSSEIKLSEGFLSILKKSLDIALEVKNLKGKETINEGDIIIAAFKNNEFFEEVLVDMELKAEDIENIINWYYLQKRLFIKKPFWDPSTIVYGIGDEWSFGYANMLSRFGVDWTRRIASVASQIHTYGVGRVITEMEGILSRGEKNNVLLIGEPGIGKEPAVNGLAAKIIRRETLSELQYKKIYKINVGALLSGANREGEVEARITTILNEAIYAGNIILYMEDIHSIFSSEESTGSVNASSIILPYLKESGLQVIGTTTLENYHKDIEANPGIASVFERIEMKEPAKETVISILEDVIPRIEYRNKVIFIYTALKETVEAAERYIYDKPFPEKAIDLVDEVAAQVRKDKGSGAIITKEDIDKVVSQRANIPVGEVEETEKEKLLKLEEFLHQRVIGQDEAIAVIANALRRARSGLTSGKRPIGTFLFLGPTGVGKTETARALAEAYFGSEKNMVRLDMSEFGEQQSIYRLIGSPPGAGQEGTQGQLTKAIKDNPFSLILLDELEKAHSDILNLFLQVFDDGRLTDGMGKTVNFTNTIIIATSNAGSEVIRESITQGIVDNTSLKAKLLNYLQTKGIFKPEFLNRFDALVAFQPLNKDQLNQVIELMMKELNKTLSEKEVVVELSPEAKQKIIEAGYDPVFGARPLRRALQDKVENLVAQKLLDGSLQKGHKMLIKGEDIK